MRDAVTDPMDPSEAGPTPDQPPLDARSQILTELADVDGHLSFIEGLLARHELTASERSWVEKEISRVRRRQTDPTVTMAVVGEFSAGKSSFINALLREELFETDAVQGTTTAATVIYHGPERVLRVHDQPGEAGELIVGPAGREEVARELAARTSGTGVGRRFLSLEHPSDFLANGVRIIDTPGTNSLTQWHDALTRRTISDLADACIVLTPAVEPLSQTLRDFLRDTLADQLPSCVFVLTKIDLVRPRERGRVMAYARRVLADEFGLADAPVFTYCSLPEVEGFAEENRATERAILELLRERRVQLQVTRCVSLLERILKALRARMRRTVEERARERERLEAATHEDVSDFVGTQRPGLLHAFQDRVDEGRSRLLGELDALAPSAREEADRGLDICSNQTQVRAYLSLGLAQRLERWQRGALERLGNGRGGLTATDEVRAAAEDGRAAFERAFLDQYRTLTALGRELDIPLDTSFELDEANVTEAISREELAEEAARGELADTNRFMGSIAGGAAAGAVIGSVVPGVGTLIGAAAGGVAGFMGWNSTSTDPMRLSRLRSEVRGPVRAATDAYLAAFDQAVVRGYLAYANRAWAALDRLMADYRAVYGRAIALMRAHDQAEQSRVECELEQLRDDERRAERRMEELGCFHERLAEAHDFYIRTALDYVHEHYQQDISVEDIARQTGLNRSYFGKVFKAAHGVSPREWRHRNTGVQPPNS